MEFKNNYDLGLKNKIINDETLRWVEIYKIRNKINQKAYIGQAISHRKNNGRYYPKGMEGRFKEHIKESRPKQKYHCNALNNAIKSYGKENFIIELLHTCSIEEANKIETDEIKNNNSLVPNGYNINKSCNSLLPSIEMRKKISEGNIDTHYKRHIKKFENFVFDEDEANFHKYITPRIKNSMQVGWYLRINKKVIEFKSSICSLSETKQRALKFITLLKEVSKKRQRDQIAGSSLEPSLPPQDGNILGELG